MVSVWHQSTARAIRMHRIHLFSYHSRGTLMSYTDHSVQRRLKSNAPIVTNLSENCFRVQTTQRVRQGTERIIQTDSQTDSLVCQLVLSSLWTELTQKNEWMNELCIYIALYCVLLYTKSALQSCGGSLLNHHQCAASTWMNHSGMGIAHSPEKSRL